VPSKLYRDYETGEFQEGPDDHQRWRPIPGDEYVKFARPIDWVVEDRIPSRATMILAGAAKRAKKTLLALHLAECVARGASWIGHEVRKREAVFTGFEGGRSFLAQRLLDVGHSTTFGDEVPAPIFFADGMRGYEDCLGEMRRRAAAGESYPILWIIDTLSQVLARSDIDENDNMAVTRYLAGIDEVAIAVDAAVLFVHHFSKQGMQMRGASAMMGVCNWCDITTVKGGDGALRLDWVLRHGPGGADGVKVQKPNGKFTFEVVDLAEVSKREGANRDEVVRESIADYLKSRSGQIVTVTTLQEVASKVSGRHVGKRAVMDVARFLARKDDRFTSSIGGSEPGYVWRE
jgi:Arc/MetJ-type ribon-helix-helix transcriptional regulator